MNLLEKEIANIGKEIVEKSELSAIVKKYYPNYKESSINWVIYKLTQNKVITKITKDKYVLGFLKAYQYKGISETSLKLTQSLKDKFSDIDMVVYETFILNEWLNHLIYKNIIIVEVEKFFMVDVFRFIKKYHHNTLFNPSKDDLYLYSDVDIIVNQLITQAPISKKDKTIKIEKIIVDLFTHNVINEFISETEKVDMIKSILKNYVVDQKTIAAYSKRRNNYDIVKSTLDNIRRNEDEL